jgi:UDP-glucose 4-epimerase
MARYFAAHGYSTACLDLIEWPAAERSQWGVDHWVVGDVTERTLSLLADRAGTPQVVFHAAGSGSVGYSFDDPLKDFEQNVASTARVLDFLRQRAPGAYFLLPSSAAVYGIQPPGPIRENVALSPVSPYGFHKVMAESLCRSMVENFGLSGAVIRYFSLYGPELRKQLLWDLAGKVLEQHDVVTLFGTGNETRDMLYVEDAARLALLLAQRHNPGLTIVNGGTGVASSVRDIAQTLIEKMDKRVTLKFSQEVRSGDPMHYQADIDNAREFGFEPRWSLGDGLKIFADWLAAEHPLNCAESGRISGTGAY